MIFLEKSKRRDIPIIPVNILKSLVLSNSFEKIKFKMYTNIGWLPIRTAATEALPFSTEYWRRTIERKTFIKPKEDIFIKLFIFKFPSSFFKSLFSRIKKMKMKIPRKNLKKVNCKKLKSLEINLEDISIVENRRTEMKRKVTPTIIRIINLENKLSTF
ncbi:MAG: hypothetical protein XD76_0093 [candidate division TA06 bacterium 32_111]|uniref:Uncharacterized protein n=1 Tax=candidate division TA06 bacterium 34_109 TaxID=1635277 RepID=A0A117M757_UNCT6|nr:MAG: hypothetical protein XD76_0093 [candidate division TA06 bacterium 32_111]KUK88091.1 MAG: hypothetical protein XE03_0097 [candidate division TA06 bacterium 34_109]